VFILQFHQAKKMQNDISSCMLVVLKEAYRSGGCVRPFGGRGKAGGFPARSVFLRLGRWID